MSQRIQAYFATESDAEHVHGLLQTYDVREIEIGELDQSLDHDTPLLFPFAVSNGTANTPIGSAAGLVVGNLQTADAFAGLRPEGESAGEREADTQLRYSLSALVDDRDYDAVVQLIRSSGGHVAAVN